MAAGQEEILAAMRAGAELKLLRFGGWVLVAEGINGPGFNTRSADGRSVNALLRRGAIDYLADGTYRMREP